MRRYVAKRVAQAVLVLWAAWTLSFILLSALPGDAVSNRIADPEANISPEGAKLLLEYYGLDQPLWQQYLHSLWSVLHGDFGYSLSNATAVESLIADALPNTIKLTLLGLAFGVAFSIVVALTANYAPWSWLRNTAGSVPALFASVPTFVVGILAVQYLSFRWHLIPSVDDGTFRALVAPAATLGLLVAAPISQVLTASIRKTRNQPFVHVLHAKGAGERFIFRKDVLRNSSLPVLTLLGLAFGELIAGSVVTESVFARNGIGLITVNAVNTQDLPVVQGVVLLSTLVYVSINLLVDLAYPFIDPRILVETAKPRRSGLKVKAAKVVGAAAPVAVPAAEPESGRRRIAPEVAMP